MDVQAAPSDGINRASPFSLVFSTFHMVGPYNHYKWSYKPYIRPKNKWAHFQRCHRFTKKATHFRYPGKLMYKSRRIQICPKKKISPIILFWGRDWDHQSYSREGSGFLGNSWEAAEITWNSHIEISPKDKTGSPFIEISTDHLRIWPEMHSLKLTLRLWKLAISQFWKALSPKKPPLFFRSFFSDVNLFVSGRVATLPVRTWK